MCRILPSSLTSLLLPRLPPSPRLSEGAVRVLLLPEFPLLRPLPMKCVKKSIGNGNIIVEFFSADIELSVWNNKYCQWYFSCFSFILRYPLKGFNLGSTLLHNNIYLTWRYLSCKAEDDSAMTSEASLNALEAFCSPSAAITYIWIGLCFTY